MQWYKHYIADYQQDTADLTLIEQGAYRALLDAYYQREGPLPNDMKVINRLEARYQEITNSKMLGKIS